LIKAINYKTAIGVSKPLPYKKYYGSVSEVLSTKFLLLS
jgi:hypothetical protein